MVSRGPRFRLLAPVPPFSSPITSLIPHQLDVLPGNRPGALKSGQASRTCSPAGCGGLGCLVGVTSAQRTPRACASKYFWMLFYPPSLPRGQGPCAQLPCHPPPPELPNKSSSPGCHGLVPRTTCGRHGRTIPQICNQHRPLLPSFVCSFSFVHLPCSSPLAKLAVGVSGPSVDLPCPVPMY